MMWIQVSGGKMHAVDANPDGDAFKKEHVTVCSRKVRAVNVFDSRDTALDYTGGRTQFMCRSCCANHPIG